MKKIIVAILSLIMLFSVIGCTGGNRAIAVVGRENGSGTREAFESLVKNGEGKKLTEVGYVMGILEKNGTGLVKATIAGNPNSIGYISLGSLDDTVKALKIEGKEASIENVQNGEYGLWRPFEVLIDDAVVGEDGSGTPAQKDFAKYLESKQCQAVIAASVHGYASINSVTNEWISTDGLTAQSGEIKILGSTSVEPLMAEIISAYCAATGLEQNVFSMVAQGSSYGRQGIKDNTCQFGMASSVTKLDESYSTTVRKINNELEGEFSGQLCRDGLAIVVHPSNKLESISIGSLFGIYSGVITKFSELN